MSVESSPVLPESIADSLRASILSQADAPGSALTESAVALRFGVARPTARIAIEKLVADGLLRREAHRAARVPELTGDDIVDLFDNRALVEGAAMAALAALEDAPRGAYCGALGLIRPGGHASFSVGIRTVVIDGARGRAECGIGSGIVMDSAAAAEYAEWQSKRIFLDRACPDYELLETLRLRRNERNEHKQKREKGTHNRSPCPAIFAGHFFR